MANAPSSSRWIVVVVVGLADVVGAAVSPSPVHAAARRATAAAAAHERTAFVRRDRVGSARTAFTIEEWRGR
jgi:hypothetical protein